MFFKCGLFGCKKEIFIKEIKQDLSFPCAVLMKRATVFVGVGERF